MSYSGALVGGGLFTLCVLVAVGLKWWHHRQQRKFDEILRARANEANIVSGKSTGPSRP